MSLELQRSFGMQQTVRLLDDLGERYGSEHVYFNLRSPAEAIRLLCINYPALQQELTEAHQYGVGYTLVQAGTFLGYEDLKLPLGTNDLVLAPVIAGSGGSTTQILVGVGLIAAAFVVGPAAGGFLGIGAGLGGATGAGAAISMGLVSATAATAIGAIGASLILSGVAQLVSPQPDPIKGTRFKPGENTNASGPQGVSRATSGQQSYAFQGPANTVGIGATVPLAYGEVLIGSHLLSTQIAVTDESDPTSESIVKPGLDTVTVNGEKPSNRFESLGGLRTRKWNNQSRITNHSGQTGSQPERASGPDIDLISTSKHDATDVDYHSNDRRKNFQVCLELDKGLFNRVGRTKVPGFVTYEIRLELKGADGPDIYVATVRATIQGLLNSNQSYKWCHAIAYSKTSAADEDSRIDAEFRIIDFDCLEKPNGRDNARLRVRSVGYKHFRDNSQDFSQDLAST